jgi:hypothetical protein
MDFRGHLRLPEDAGTGIPVTLRVDDIFVVIASEGEELGSWRADEMSVERIFSNQFALDLAGEPMVFLAADALGFAYEGVTAIEELQARLTKRRVFKRKKSAPKAVPTPALTDPEETPVAEAAPDEVPTDEPVLLTDPQPLWTPPVAKEAPGPVADPEPAPPPADASKELRDRPDPEEAAPVDSRVVYPAARTVEPDTVPQPDQVAVSEPEPDPVAEVPITEDDEHEWVELEIEVEDVGLASSGGSWVGPDATLKVEVEESELGTGRAYEPVAQREAPVGALDLLSEAIEEAGSAEDDELEIEDYEPAAAAQVDTFVAPVEDAGAVLDESLPTPADSVEVPASEEPQTPEPVVSQQPDAAPDEPGVELRAEETVEDRQPEVAPLAAAVTEDSTQVAEADSAADDSAPLNGHKEEQSRAEKKPSLFRRSRDKKPAPHDHEYGEPKTIGGLKRSVCEICGHVTFSGEDVYQGW